MNRDGTNMMFETKLNAQLNQQTISDIENSIDGDNLEITPIGSLEEIALLMKNNDDHYRYDYFLVESKTPLIATPPPFRKVIAEPVAERSAESPAVMIQAPELMVEPEMEAAPAPQSSSQDSQAIEKDDVFFLIENADLLFSAGETELARNLYRAVLKTGEANEVAYAGLALCADRNGLVEQAIQFAWDSVAFAPNKKGYQILAQLLVQQGRDQEAAQALSRALKSLELTIQEKAEYQKMIGNCMSRLGNNAEAERAYKKALELSPASDEVQANLGSLYLEQGQVSEAKRCYQDAIAANPENDKAWVGLGLCHVNEGDKESAHEAFARSLDKNLRNSTAIFHLVKCAYEIKTYSPAEKILSHYIEVAPVSPSLLYSLAGLQFHVGKKKEATVTAKRILQMKADHQGARELIQRIESNI